MQRFGDVTVSRDGHVAVCEIRRPPNNFFDEHLIENLADAFEAEDRDDQVRCLLLCTEGKHFCAGAHFQADQAADNIVSADGKPSNLHRLYQMAVRLYRCRKPIVGAIQGAAIGGGFGLALVPDFRIVSAESRFSANFVKLGFHPGFGMTLRLPQIIGPQRAHLLFLTGRRIDGQTAYDWGLADVLAPLETLRDEAMALAQEIAANAPLAVQSTRATLRAGLAEQIHGQADHELVEQTWLRETQDHREGIRAVAERRVGEFKGR